MTHAIFTSSGNVVARYFSWLGKQCTWFVLVGANQLEDARPGEEGQFGIVTAYGKAR